MTTPISFTVRPPSAAPHRPSPLGNGGGSSRSGPPSRRLFETSNGDDDEDDEGDDSYDRNGSRGSRPREERIDGFGRDGKATGYVSLRPMVIELIANFRGKKPEGPLVIPSLPNRDWRQSSSRRTPSYRPEARRQETTKDEEDKKPDRIGDEPQRSGLRFASKPEPEQEDVKPDMSMLPPPLPSNGHAASTYGEDSKPDLTKIPDAKPMTLEEQALQALLAGDHSTESDAERAQRELVIQSERDREIGAWSEEDALQRDLDALPEESTRDDYNTVPIEAFGMAMLRGMGWNPNDDSNTKIHVPKARPGQLGLGATPMSEIIPPSHDKKSKREDRAKRGGRGYNASGAMIKREIGGSDRGSATPTPAPTAAGSSRRPSPDSADVDSDASKRRRRDDDYDSGSSRRKERDDTDRYETEEERARRKAKERARDREYETDEERARRKAREKERDRDRGRDDRYSNGGDRDRDRRNDRYDDRDRDRGDRDRRDRDRDRDRDYRK